MKQLLTILLFAFLAVGTNAQTFPLPGATWYFTADNTSGHPYAEKLEYLGDSVAANGVYKKMLWSEKLVNPDWATNDTTYLFSGMVYYRYSGDTIFRKTYTNEEDFICNFSLAVGDSSYTPYYSLANLAMLQPSDVGFCTAVDSALLSRKGVVSETGTETADGVTYRYYKLLYNDAAGNADSVTFSERSIITARYWLRPVEHFCGIDWNPVLNYLLCFSDDSSAVPCAEEDWYNHLGLDDPALAWKGEVYPNPAAGSATVTNPAPYAVTVQLTDLDGRAAGKRFEVAGNASATIDLSALANGTYIVSLQTTGGVIRKRLVVNP